MKYGTPVYRVALVRDGRCKTRPMLADPAAVARLVREVVGGTPKEHMVSIMLDTKNQAIGINVVSMGTLTASLVHPRELYQAAILSSAAGIVIAHNHPSGISEPSQDDKSTTRRMKKAGDILGIPLLDHVIVTDKEHFSFRVEGLL